MCHKEVSVAVMVGTAALVLPGTLLEIVHFDVALDGLQTSLIPA